ncbi:MAG: hypothetical protein ACC707_01600 [Thiohalomonadales bacterium]
MHNRFHIDAPKSTVGQSLIGIGNILGQARKEKAAKTKAEQVQKGFMEAFQSGDPNKVAEFVSKNPDSEKILQNMFQYKDAKTKQNQVETLREVLANPTPDGMQNAMVNRVKYLESVGADPSTTLQGLDLLGKDPEAFLRNAEMGLSAVDPKGYKAFSKSQKEKEGMTDYQRESLDLKIEANEIRQLENDARRADNEIKRDELKYRLNERKKKAREEQVKKKIDAKAKIRASDNLSESIDLFLSNDDYIDSVTGYRGRLPSLTTTAIEAEAYLDNIKNNLTLENLGKMSGVLSETDIKILSTSASAIRAGLSKKELAKEMRKIQGILKTKSADVNAMIMAEEQPEIKKQADQQSSMSIDELLNKYGN